MKIDLTKIEKIRLMQQQIGEDILSELIEIYLDTVPPMLFEMSTSLGANDFVQFRKTAHSLKSSAANLGVVDLYEHCVLVESADAAGGYETFSILLEKIKSAFEESKPLVKAL